MRRTTTAASDSRGEVAFDHSKAGVLVLAVSGAWVLRGTRARSADVDKELSGAKKLAFDATALGDWDTALLTFLAEVIDLARKNRIDVDRSGLPDGVQRLLALAEAVPEKEGARGRHEAKPLLERIGLAALDVFEQGRQFLEFVGSATLAMGRLLTFRARFRRVDLLVHLQDCGAQALPIVTLISFLLGLILAFMGAVQLRQFGASIYVADLVGLAMAREMGAVMTGIIMAGRTGAAFAAQLGTMKVTEEIDALATMGISPMEFLVLPRMVALFLMMPLLCVYADLVGILGGAVVGVTMLDLSATEYFHETIYAVQLKQFALGVAKSAVFGVLIALSGCLRGLQSGSSASAVGDAATSAVVTSIVFIIVTDGVFAVACNILGI